MTHQQYLEVRRARKGDSQTGPCRPIEVCISRCWQQGEPMRGFQQVWCQDSVCIESSYQLCIVAATGQPLVEARRPPWSHLQMSVRGMRAGWRRRRGCCVPETLSWLEGAKDVKVEEREVEDKSQMAGLHNSVSVRAPRGRLSCVQPWPCGAWHEEVRYRVRYWVRFMGLELRGEDWTGYKLEWLKTQP